MRKWMLFGSLTGFVAGLLTGLWRENSSAVVLWRACVLALAGGWLTRWWAKSLYLNLKEAFAERAAAQAADETPTAAPTPKP